MSITQKIELTAQDGTELEVEFGDDTGDGAVILEIRIDNSDIFRVDLTDRRKAARIRALGSLLDTGLDLARIERIARSEAEYEKNDQS